MDLRLNDNETELLRRLLRYQLGELRMEIADTDRLAWREKLHEDEVMMKALLERLGETVETSARDAGRAD